MNFKTVLGTAAVVVLFLLGVVSVFFGAIFAIAASVANTVARQTTAAFLLGVGIMLFIAGGVTAYFLSKKPQTVVQKLELSGQMQTVALKCPNCSASVEAGKIKVVSGVPYATCSYCGHTFEVAEEPKW